MTRWAKDWDQPIDKPVVLDSDGDPVRRMAGFIIKIDTALPPGIAEFRHGKRVVGRITNIQPASGDVESG